MNLLKARSLLLAVAALVAAGCVEKTEAPAGPAETSLAGSTNSASTNAAPGAAGNPQPKLRTVRLWLGPNELIAEVARTSQEIQTGMMFRTNIGETEGMLFVFNYPHRTGFWMKNTLLPLSCAYIDSEGIILETHDMFPHVETPITAASDKVQYVLEVKQGWFKRNNVAPGALVRTEKGSLRETFFAR